MILFDWDIKNIYIWRGDWPVFDMKVKTLLAVIESGSYTKGSSEAESDPAGGESSDSFAGK